MSALSRHYFSTIITHHWTRCYWATVSFCYWTSPTLSLTRIWLLSSWWWWSAHKDQSADSSMSPRARHLGLIVVLGDKWSQPQKIAIIVFLVKFATSFAHQLHRWVHHSFLRVHQSIQTVHCSSQHLVQTVATATTVVILAVLWVSSSTWRAVLPHFAQQRRQYCPLLATSHNQWHNRKRPIWTPSSTISPLRTTVLLPSAPLAAITTALSIATAILNQCNVNRTERETLTCLTIQWPADRTVQLLVMDNRTAITTLDQLSLPLSNCSQVQVTLCTHLLILFSSWWSPFF